MFLCLSVCLSVCLSLSLSLSFALILSEWVYQCPAILSLIVGVYVRLLIRVSLCLFPWRFLLLFGYIFCISVGLYCHWLYVYMYVSWSVLLSLSVSMPQWVLGYIVTGCMCTGTSLDPRFSLSFSLSVSVSGYIIGKSACIRTSLDSYFFVSLCL